jgi:hypothetical protein
MVDCSKEAFSRGSPFFQDGAVLHDRSLYEIQSTVSLDAPIAIGNSRMGIAHTAACLSTKMAPEAGTTVQPLKAGTLRKEKQLLRISLGLRLFVPTLP